MRRIAHGTAILTVIAPDGAVITADSMQSGEGNFSPTANKITVVRDRVAIASSGAGLISLPGPPVFEYQFHQWVREVIATLGRAEPTPSRIAAAIQRAAEEKFNVREVLRILASEDTGNLYFVMAGATTGQTPSIAEVYVRGGSDRPVTKIKPHQLDGKPHVFLFAGFHNDTNDQMGAFWQEALRAARANSWSLESVEGLAKVSGLLMSIEARANAKIGPPFRQVIVRPGRRAERRAWQGSTAPIL